MKMPENVWVWTYPLETPLKISSFMNHVVLLNNILRHKPFPCYLIWALQILYGTLPSL